MYGRDAPDRAERRPGSFTATIGALVHPLGYLEPE